MQKILWGMLLLAGTLFSAELVWQKGMTSAFEKAQKENKVVMVLVEGDHCGWCTKMKESTLSADSVSQRLEPYILVKVMHGNREDVKDLPIIKALPTIFFLNANKKVLESVVGYSNIVEFAGLIDSVEKKVPLKK